MIRDGTDKLMFLFQWKVMELQLETRTKCTFHLDIEYDLIDYVFLDYV